MRNGLRPILLGGLLILAIVAVFPVRAAISQHSSNSSAQWRQVGLAGDTVHALSLGHGALGPAFAGTEQGVFRRTVSTGWTKVLPDRGVWSVVLLPDDHTVIAGDDAGRIAISSDAGDHWRRISLSSQGVYVVSVQPGNPRHVLAGAGGGLYESEDGGATWTQRLKLRQSAVAALIWRPGSTRVVYAGMVAGGPLGATQVDVSRDAGRTWRLYGRDLHSGGGIMSLVAGSGNNLLAGTMGRAVWTVSGPTQSWRRSATGMPDRDDHVAGFAAIPTHPGLLFAGTLGFGVFRSSDDGLHWRTLSAGLPSSSNATIVLSLAYSPQDRALFAGTADGVYELRSP